MRRAPFLAIGTLALLAGCAPTNCDPSQAGFFDGISCQTSGAFDQREQEHRQALASAQTDALQQRVQAGQAAMAQANAEQHLASSEQRLASLDAQTDDLRRQLNAARARRNANRQQLQRAQAALAELEQRRKAVAPAQVSENQLHSLDESRSKLANILAGM